MKKKAPKGWVKISEFTELTGINAKTIMSALKHGTISAAKVARIGVGATAPYFINPAAAAKDWYASLNANHPNTAVIRKALEKYISSTITPIGLKAPTKSSPKATMPPAHRKKMTLSEAQRAEREAKARIAQLDLAEKEGSLVSRDRVNEQLFAAGKELRDALLTIPDRITDIVMASDTRSIVHSAIYDAIAAELQKLADNEIGVNR